MSDLNTQFDNAAQDAKNLPKKPDNNTLLRLYALYKQATAGDVKGRKPGFTNPVGQAKFDAWKKVKGLPRDEAMQTYIELVNKLKE
jgi:acyl-CoA-binding protein